MKVIWCSDVAYIYCQLEQGGMSGMGICAFFYMKNLFGVVVFHRSMVNWRKGIYVHSSICEVDLV